MVVLLAQEVVAKVLLHNYYKMKKIFFFLLLISLSSFSQKNLKQLLNKYNTESIPYISADSLSKLIKKPLDFTKDGSQVILLDAREPKEYAISHLKNAMCVGYDNFDINTTIQNIPTDKNTKIVVYCSLGIRSEDIAKKLKKAGYTNIYNLYGGIFEWKNHDNTVVNSKENPTNRIHVFNKEWSKWLLKKKEKRFMSKNLLLIFTRNPELGKVKTRLAKSVGNETALEIYKFLLNKTKEVTQNIACDKAVYYSVKIRQK